MADDCETLHAEIIRIFETETQNYSEFSKEVFARIKFNCACRSDLHLLFALLQRASTNKKTQQAFVKVSTRFLKARKLEKQLDDDIYFLQRSSFETPIILDVCGVERRHEAASFDGVEGGNYGKADRIRA